MKKRLRILYALPQTMDLGGIAPSTEHIIAGMRQLGHDCEFMYIKQTKSNTRGTGDAEPGWKKYAGQWVSGEGTGVMFHPMLGWGGPGWSLYDRAHIDLAVNYMNTFDIVVWGAAFGFKVNWYEGSREWLDVFSKVKAKKIVMIRDDHFWGRQSWNVEFDQYVDGWACVNACGFDECEGLTKPRAVIHSPHDLSDLDRRQKPMGKRKPGIFSVQNAKSWKRVDEIVRCVPYLQHTLWLAGEGLVIRNMRAPADGGKLKPGYIVNHRADPSAHIRHVGRPIWDVAIAEGMQYLGPVNEATRDKCFSDIRFGLDLSTRENTGQINRVYIEAAKHGCVMLAVPEFMSGVNGTNWIKPGVHYLPVHSGRTPVDLAMQLDDAFKLKASKYAQMQDDNYEAIQRYDRRTACQQLIDLAMGKKTGWRYSKGDPSAASSPAYIAGRELFTQHFGE
jgi:hypothetical protein